MLILPWIINLSVCLSAMHGFGYLHEHLYLISMYQHGQTIQEVSHLHVLGLLAKRAIQNYCSCILLFI